MPRYYIKISGSAFNIEGETPEEALEIIKTHLHVYCHFQILEIGKDVDENGWPIKD